MQTLCLTEQNVPATRRDVVTPPRTETRPAVKPDLPRDDVFELHCAVQHYSWGDTRFIPALIGRENSAGKPYAELWMGVHPDAPSKVVWKREAISLAQLIQAKPERLLHPTIAVRFGGQLPFLFKVLAAGSPLSVQVHPTRFQAEAGFVRESAAGISLESAHRNYRDANHKPELIVAVTDFYALRGFRPVAEISRVIEEVPELRSLTGKVASEPGALRKLYSTLMLLPQESVNRALSALVRQVEQARWDRPYARTDWEYWLLRANDKHSRVGRLDRGLFAFLLLNLVHLRPGEGMFLPSGVLHSYLEGVGMELMANSNNVIRGGLTTKHVDVPELLRNVVFESDPATVLTVQRVAGKSEWVYATPAREFELSRIELDRHNPYRCTDHHAVEIMIVLAEPGRSVRVKTRQGERVFSRGKVFLIASEASYEMHADGPATVFKATVPLALPPAASVTVETPVPAFRGRQPAVLSFGTSGLRGLVKDITDLEAYVNARGFLEYALEFGKVASGEQVSIAADLRPSSDSAERSILRAVARAVEDSGLRVDHLGRLPTPALTSYALRHGRLSIMVTGSHIPFDRNGIKFNLRAGEISKSDEAPILRYVRNVRRVEYTRPAAESPFADDGMFKPGKVRHLPVAHAHACLDYLCRYLDFLPHNALEGMRIIFYQHSAVGRDLLTVLLRSLGAEVLSLGRSEEFVPVDTEAISEDQLQLLQRLADHARRERGHFDAIVSTDGDSDRPLLVGITADGRVKFYGGDLLGIVTADFLNADAVAVPISANDAVDRWAAAQGVSVVKTRIGSPHVIEAMQQARANGAARVVGWEANGGFLTATDIVRNGRTLAALPTRDAALPLLAALCGANEQGVSLSELFAKLPPRFGKSGLMDNFPLESSRTLLQRFQTKDAPVQDVTFPKADVHGNGAAKLDAVKRDLECLFSPQAGFDDVARINTLDGVRIWFRNGDIAHIRPSGNAPQLRIYAVADTQARADQIVAQALREPDGILRRMATGVSEVSEPAGQSEFTAQIRKNIALTAELFARGETPEVIGTVSGSCPAQKFWQNALDAAREEFKAAAAVSVVEDLPTNQAFGLLLLWQRLKSHLGGDRGALVAFVFGDGTRSTPFTETDGAQKPAIATFVPATPAPGARFLSMVELALRYFVPVQQFLRRSGFDGLVVKWGDEVQIPTRALLGADPLFDNADIVRFVSLREVTADEAKNKDWVGVNERGQITAFIPRRPIQEMEALANRGLLQRRAGKLWGGVNLGSIAVSRALLDCLLAEFRCEVNDARACRADRPALDPEFFAALTLAVIEDPQQRAEEWQRAATECAELRVLQARIPNLIFRLRRAILNLADRQGRPLKMVAMDFGDQYWGDIGQHTKIHDFYLALNETGPAGDVARAMAGLDSRRDERGNLIVNSVVSPDVQVSNSVLINATLTGRGAVERSVLIGTRAGNVRIRQGFDVMSTVVDLSIEPRGGTYKAVARTPVHAAPAERLTTLFLPSLGPQIFRVKEDTDLKDKAANYDRPIGGNPLSFRQAHVEMGTVDAEVLEKCRREAESVVLESLQRLVAQPQAKGK